MQRALPQIIDHPRVFEDPYALPVLGPLLPAELQAAADVFGPAESNRLTLQTGVTAWPSPMPT